MSHAAKLARDEALVEALRATADAIGDEDPTSQAARIIRAIQALRDGSVRVPGSDRIDYLERVQIAAKRAWHREHPANATGPEYDARAAVDTPIGPLGTLTWRRRWSDGRIAWASEYYLNDEPITLAEIKAAGLARRPTTRNRVSKKRCGNRNKD